MTVVGSLCSGYGGLEMGAALALGDVEVAWHAENDKAPAAILAHHYPDVPNLGDLTKVDWTGVARVDAILAGFPCQDVSHAGKRAGLRAGTRTGIWSYVATAIDVLRPRFALLENVGGLLNAGADSDVEPCPWCMGDAKAQPPLRALGAVLADLADIGYDARWRVVRAADAGAPHGRARVFIVASAEHPDCGGHPGGLAGVGRPLGGRRDDPRVPATAPDPGADVATDTSSERHGSGVHPRRVGRLDGADAGEARERQRAREVAGDRGAAAAADAAIDGRERGGRARDGRTGPADSRVVAADASRDGRDEGRPEPARLVGGPHAPVRGHAAPDTDVAGGEARIGRPGTGDARRLQPLVSSDTAWGVYAPAIRRWERVTGRPAPRPTEPGRRGERLSPRFVEWMQGLPAGWVTDVPGIPRNAQLKALGNGVVPQQAALAVRLLAPELCAADCQEASA